MPVGSDGDDVFASGAGGETVDGGAGVDTASYATAARGVVANLGTGVVAYVPRIMPLGDSITYGAPLANSTGGYRGPLWDRVTADNLVIDFVGSASNGKLEDPQHEGHGGFFINEIDAQIATWTAAARPDMILLIIGTNDTNRGSPTPQEIAARLGHLIDDITAQPGAPQIFVGPIPPMVAQSAQRVALAQAYNALIPGVVADKQAAGVDVTFVDMSDLTPADITPPPADGGLHPNASGYQKIAADWYDALLAGGTDNGTFSGTPRDRLISIENVEGSAYKDRLIGDGGANRLSGLAGHDFLDGAGGADTLVGGLGDDIYVVDTAGDQVVENLGEGADAVRTGLASYALGSNVEHLIFTGAGAFAGTGNALANSIVGGGGNDTLDGGAGRDTLLGGAGDDRLVGGGAEDRMDGGAGDDTYTVDSSGDVVIETLGAGGGVDSVESSRTYTLGVNVENLTLTGASAINATGNGDANVLTGNSRNNLLSGQAGADTLAPGAGFDTLSGGDGADVFLGSTSDLNGDRITDYEAGDRIVLLQDLASAANVQLDTSGSLPLLKIDADNNGAFEAVLTLQAGAPDRLAVGSGFGRSNNVITLTSEPTLSVAATDATKLEGNSGATGFTFTVSRAGDLSTAATVDWAVTGSGARPAAASDFVGGSLPAGQLSFAVGEASKMISVGVAGDTTPEADEGFTLTLSNPSGGAVLSQATAAGLITDDDSPALRLAATDAVKAEGNSGSTPFTFTVTRSGDLSAAASADWAVTGSGVSAANAADFGGALPTGAVSFAAGESAKVITVNVTGDAIFEANEGFAVTLSNASGATTIAQASAVGSITNDDFTLAPDLDPLSDTGTSNSDNVTNDTTPTFVGLAQAGSTVRLLEGTKQLGQAVADASGAWTITSSALSGGSHGISTLDDTGAPRSATLTVTIDVAAPSAPSKPDLAPDSDLGQSNSDNLTSDATPTFRGSAQAGTLITLQDGSAVIGTAVTDTLGKWSVTSAALPAGAHAITARAADIAGNISAVSGALTVTIDLATTAPLVTSATTTKLIGLAEPGAIVHVFDGGTALGQVIATSSGTWSISKTLSNTLHTINVTADDRAGNSASSGGQVLFGSSTDNSLTGGDGDDRVIGLAGADTLTGGSGEDVFVFGGGFGHDVIGDFLAGPSGGDRIELARSMLGLGSGASPQTAFDAVLARTGDGPDGALIAVDAQDTITLSGVSKATLGLSDFIFT